MSSTVTHLRAEAIAEGLREFQPVAVAYVPSKTVAPIIASLSSGAQGTGAPRVFPVGREEEAVGIIGGVTLAGLRGAIIMQDNGFGNSLTALTTFALAYRRPILIVANARGGLGEYNSTIHAISAAIPEILRAVSVPYFVLDRRSDPDDWRATTIEAGRHARMTHRPAVVLLDFWDGSRGGHVA